jgi:hypothetical protein
LPESLKNAHPMFFCFGPFAMFSNLGEGIGRITYAEVTNFGTTTKTEMLATWNRLLHEGLNPEEKEKYGKKILEGVAKFIPEMINAQVLDVLAGIVISEGDVRLEDISSDFHKRRHRGVKELQIGAVTALAMKFCHGPINAEEVAKILEKQIELQKGLIKSIIKNCVEAIQDEEKKAILKDFFSYYISKYFQSTDFPDEDKECSVIPNTVLNKERNLKQLLEKTPLSQ